MRYTFLFLYIMILMSMISCDHAKPTTDDVVKSNFELYIQDKLNDPDSYEFVSLEKVDSFTYLDNIENRIEYFSSNIDRNKNRIDRILGYKSRLPSMYDESEHSDMLSEIEKDSLLIIGINGLKDGMGSKVDSIASYTYYVKFRSNNALGSKVLNEYMIQTSNPPQLEIINLTNDPGKMYVTPNGFPGYDEFVRK